MRGNYARFVIDWHGIDGIAGGEALRTLWLQELVTRFLEDPEYAAAFSPAGQKRLKACLADLREV